MSANTKENTMRSLKGEPRIQRLRCRLGWHRWTTWQYNELDMNTMRGGYATCVCADCGMPRMESPYTKTRKNV